MFDDFKVSAEDWNQDGAWYNTLALMERMGIKTGRQNFKKVLREQCKKLGITREELGIVASPWATMYYKGIWSPVSYEDIERLSLKGTDVIFTEKMDIAKIVGHPASKNGAAMVNTRGNLSDYADELSDLAEKSGGHVGIAVDYDIPGILIASKLVKKGVLWLGVDEDMLRYFGMSKENKNIVVAYKPKRDRMKPENFKNLVNSIDRFKNSVDIEFLKEKKIELNAVLATVGGQRLWEYFRDLLVKEYPKRNYNRAIESHPDLSKHYPMGIRVFSEYIKDHEDTLVKDDIEKIESENKDVEGFIDVPEREEEIDNDLGAIIEEDELLIKIGSILKKSFKKQDPQKWMELTKMIEEQDKKEPPEPEEPEEDEDRGSDF